MALSTDTARKISENLISDQNANIEQAAPPPRKVSPEAAILLDKSIIARPLMTPSVGEIHIKNSGYYYRWVAALACGGQVYTQRKAMGFENATTNDVELLSGSTTGNDHEIRAGDLILMKLPFERWASHVKSNMLKAQAQVRMRGVYNKNTPSTSVFSDDKPERDTISNEPFVRGTEPFIPKNPDAIIDAQSPAAVTAARNTTQEIRERIARERSVKE